MNVSIGTVQHTLTEYDLKVIQEISQFYSNRSIHMTNDNSKVPDIKKKNTFQ